MGRILVVRGGVHTRWEDRVQGRTCLSEMLQKPTLLMDVGHGIASVH